MAPALMTEYSVRDKQGPDAAMSSSVRFAEAPVDPKGRTFLPRQKRRRRCRRIRKRPECLPSPVVRIAVALVLVLAVGATADAASRPNLAVRNVEFGSCRSIGDCWTARVRNIGPRATRRATRVYFFVSSDDRLSPDDRRDDQCWLRIPPLRPGRSYEVITCADDLQYWKPGMFVIACVDVRNRIRESLERDNCKPRDDATIHP